MKISQMKFRRVDVLDNGITDYVFSCFGPRGGYKRTHTFSFREDVPRDLAHKLGEWLKENVNSTVKGCKVERVTTAYYSERASRIEFIYPEFTSGILHQVSDINLKDAKSLEAKLFD